MYLQPRDYLLHVHTHIYKIYDLQQKQTQNYQIKRANRTNYVRTFGICLFIFFLLDTQKGKTLRDITKVIYKSMFRIRRIFS